MIDEKIAEFGGWRGETLARLRGLVKQAEPEVVEERVHDGHDKQ
jgi:hypothetical protein